MGKLGKGGGRCVCVRACVRACVLVCVRACVRTCVRARVPLGKRKYSKEGDWVTKVGNHCVRRLDHTSTVLSCIPLVVLEIFSIGVFRSSQHVAGGTVELVERGKGEKQNAT